MALALPLLIPFAEAAGIAIGTLTTAAGLDILSSKVEEYIEDNPENAQKIFAMIMPEQGLANILKNESSEGGEDIEYDDFGEEIKVESEPRSKKEIVLEEVRRGRRGRGNFSSPDAEGPAVSITGNVKRGLRDAGKIRQDNDPNYDPDKKYKGYKRFIRPKRADGGIMGGNKTYHQVRDQFMPMDLESMGYANGGGVGSMMQPKSKTLKAVNELQAKAPEGEFLAYINQGEANALKNSGGSGHLVNGIPSFVGSDYSGAGNANTSGYQGGMRGSGGYQGSTGKTNRTVSEGGSGSGNFTTPTYTPPSPPEDIDSTYTANSFNTTPKTNTGIFGGGFNPLAMILGLINPFLGIAARGIGSLKGGLKGFNEKMRGINPLTGEANTQAEYEQARFDRQQTNRLDKLFAAKDRGFNQIGFGDFTKKTMDFTPGQQSKIDQLMAQGYEPSTARNVLTGRDLGLRNTLAANNITNNNMKSELFDPNEIQSLINNAASKNTQPQGLSMMEQYYNDIDKKATGPNIVPDASTLAQQAKTFNTIDALNSLGNTTEKGFFGTGLTDQGKALEAFRNSAVNFYNSPNNTANTPGAALGFMTDPARAGISKYDSIRENKDFIQNAINQGFLQTEDDYTNQKSLKDFI